MFLVIIIFIIRHNSTIKLISRKDLTERTIFPPPERLIKWDRTGSIEGWRRLLSPVHDVVVIVIISRSPSPVPVRKGLSGGVIVVMILVSDILIMVVGGTDAYCCMSQSMILGLLVVAIPSLPSLLIDATSFGCPDLVAAPLPLHDSESMPNLSGLSFMYLSIKPKLNTKSEKIKQASSARTLRKKRQMKVIPKYEARLLWYYVFFKLKLVPLLELGGT